MGRRASGCELTRLARLCVVMLPAACSAPAPEPAPPVVAEIAPAGSTVPEPSAAIGPSPAEKDLPDVPFNAAQGDGVSCARRDAVKMWDALLSRADEELAKELVPTNAFGCRFMSKGERFSVPLVLGPSRCYAAVAHGDPSELDLVLLPASGDGGPLPPILTKVTLAKDDTIGPTAVIGTDGCFKNPLPFEMPARVEVVAVEGDGLVAVSVLIDE